MSLASVQVLTNGALFRRITAFVPGVPYIVGEFKQHEFAEHLSRHPKNSIPRRGRLRRSFVVEFMKPELLLWQVAVQKENKRVLAALNALSKTPRYAVVPHVLCVDIMGYAVACSRDIGFLEWIYINFSNDYHLQISAHDFGAAGRLGSIEVARWAQRHGYTIPAEMMAGAAGYGHLDLVRFLHEYSEGSCTTQAMDDAAAGDHLDVVQFLHENRSEGSTNYAHMRALKNGHCDVLRFLLKNREEKCQFYFINGAAINGHLDSIKFAHEQKLPLVTQDLMHEAAVAGHLDIVKYLYENGIGVCYEDSITKAGANGHHDVVQYLCQHHSPKNPGGGIREALWSGRF